LEHYDDAAARPDTQDRAAGRRRAEPTAAPGRPDAHRAGRDVIGVLLAQPAAASQAAPVAVATPVRRRRTAPPVGESTTVRFAPKRGARRVMGAVILLVLGATGGAAYLAYDEPTTLTVGVAATLGVLLLVIWGIRAGTPLTRMVVTGGQLEVKQGGLHLKFDLTSRYTPIEVQGIPGRRSWRVLFGRGMMRPFIVDSSIVDAKAFMEVLLRYRPE
jgi:hypothetical protein